MVNSCHDPPISRVAFSTMICISQTPQTLLYDGDGDHGRSPLPALISSPALHRPGNCSSPKHPLFMYFSFLLDQIFFSYNRQIRLVSIVLLPYVLLLQNTLLRRERLRDEPKFTAAAPSPKPAEICVLSHYCVRLLNAHAYVQSP